MHSREEARVTLSIDSAAFLVPIGCLVIAMRWFPPNAARVFHLVISVGFWVELLPGPRSTIAGVVFVLLPVTLQKLFAGRRNAAAFVILLQVGVFLWVQKYATLIPDLANVSWLSHFVAIVGVSYILFRQIDWVLWTDANPSEETTLVEYLNYTISLFTILAGPIARFDDFRADFLRTDIALSRHVFLWSCNRIVNGFIKIALLAPWLFQVSSVEFVSGNDYSLGSRLVSFYAYPFFIYFNFAGYCDVVIGLARLARLELPENFDRPFWSTNVQEFWQRWHMTFSTWIRDFVFYPLLKGIRTHARRVPAAIAMVVSLFLSFILVGLWHGPTLGYLVFGVLHGVAVVAIIPYGKLLRRMLSERGLERYRTHPAVRFLRVALCFHFLCATIALFERTPEQALSVMPVPW